MANEFRKVTDQNGVDHPVCDDTRVDWSSYAKTGVHQLLLMKLDTIKALNTSGTWNNNAYTWQDVTYTIQTDANGYVTGVQVNGNATGRGWLFLSENELSGVNANLTAATGNIINGIKLVGGDYTFDKQDIVYASGSKKSYILIDNGETVSNKMFYPAAIYEKDTCTDITPFAMTNRELTPQYGSVTVSEGITINSDSGSNVAVIQGKVVYIFLYITNITLSASEDAVIGTVPYLPKGSVGFLDVIDGGTPFNSIANAFVRNNGQIVIKGNSAIASKTQIYIKGTYICR